ncbi:uncharacterized protein At4g02000-like [Solanum dulcamara]|uniref:uncharacterized protein At4g02000-like n=1 Tax=Solanum dulcamara TaxID=45834 RepID=UPI0024860178|nr:uncharacterized protein At4g02000-like [Solanum dulcamara]
MEDEITDRLNKFILTEEEKDSIEIDVQDIMSSMKNCEVSLLGKVIADKQVSVLGVKNTMMLVWGNPIGLKVLLVGKNLFQFVFRHKEDVKKVLYGTSWLYSKYLINIHQWQPTLQANSHIFNMCELWLQVWNIPLHWISIEVGSKIRHALGGTSDVVIPENGSKEGRHMRIKVLMSINRPLLRGKLIKMGSKEKWVEFRYENLPYVCYYYGILGHTEKS